jgi:ribonuclease BN (tRNA processing enzyme)
VSASESESASGSTHRTRVVVVGSGTPVPDPERSGPSVAVVIAGRPLLFDAGPGVVRAATPAGLDPVALDHVFLTHLHSDHTLGLPDLLLSPWVVGRDRPLVVRGPPGSESMVDHLMAAWTEDREVRTAGLEGKGPLRVDARDVEPGVVHRTETVTVEAFAVAHGSWDHAFGYVVEGPDRRVVISGDTGPTDAIAAACDGCDVLVHEVYSAARYDRLPPSAQAYHGSFHTSSRDVGRQATAGRAKAVLLVHHLLWGATAESVVAEVREHYEGPVLFGIDGMVY